MVRFPNDAPAWADFGIDDASFMQQAHCLRAGARLEDVLRMFYQLYAQAHGKPRAGDKTPSYLQCMPDVARVLPEAHFIHIIRDGRDVAVSWSKTWFAPTRDRAQLVNLWAEQIGRARTSASGLAYMEVRFADLIRQPAAVLQDLCQFVGLKYQQQMLEYFKRSPSRLSEHQARYRLDGSLVVSKEDRLLQQAGTKSPPSHERIHAPHAQRSRSCAFSLIQQSRPCRGRRAAYCTFEDTRPLSAPHRPGGQAAAASDTVVGGNHAGCIRRPEAGRPAGVRRADGDALHPACNLRGTHRTAARTRRSRGLRWPRRLWRPRACREHRLSLRLRSALRGGAAGHHAGQAAVAADRQ